MPGAAFVETLRSFTAGPPSDQPETQTDPSVDPGTPAVGPSGLADWNGWWDRQPLAKEAKRAIQILNPSGEIQMPRPPRMRVICAANQRHAGKTTSVVNIAVTLALHGNRVLVIDLDPKGDASTSLDVPHHATRVAAAALVRRDRRTK
jgi:Mrp family chromosome partitioning ATPase